MKLVRRGIACIVAFVLVTLTVYVNPIPVHAESTLSKLQKAKEEKEKTQGDKNSAEDKKQSLIITQNSLLGQLSALNDDLSEISAHLEETEEKIADKENDIENTKKELEHALLTEENQYQSMKTRIKFMYETGNLGYLELLLSAKSFSEFLNKSDYVELVTKYDREMLDSFKDARLYVEEVKATLEKELQELEALQEDITKQQKAAADKVQKTASQVNAYSDQIQDAEETIAALEKTLSEQENNIAALQKQYEQELALSKLAQQSAWRDISEIKFEEGDRTLLANLIYCEAGGEPYEGQVAVGAVVINRLLSSRYPNTMVGVIYQRKQFSPVGSGRLAFALQNNKATASCYRAADEAMSGVTNVGQCLYFRTPIPGLTGISIGGHIFY